MRIREPNLERTLKPEMFAMMRIPLAQRVGGLQVASAAIQRESRKTFVFIRTQGSDFRSQWTARTRRVIREALRLNALWNLKEKGGNHA